MPRLGSGILALPELEVWEEFVILRAAVKSLVFLTSVLISRRYSAEAMGKIGCVDDFWDRRGNFWQN
jgi:hypothetical protein